MDYKHLSPDFYHYTGLHDSDLQGDLAHIQKRVASVAANLLARQQNDPLSLDFFRFFDAVKNTPEFLPALCTPMTDAAQDLMDKGWYDNFYSRFNMVRDIPELVEPLFLIINQTAKKIVNQEPGPHKKIFDDFWPKDFDRFIYSLRDEIVLISPQVIIHAAEKLLDQGWDDYFVRLIVAISDQPELINAIAPVITKAAKKMVDEDKHLEFESLFDAVKNIPELLEALKLEIPESMKPNYHVVLLSCKQTGHCYDVLIAFDNDGRYPVKISGGCRRVTSLANLQLHWEGRLDRQDIWENILNEFKAVAGNPNHPAARIAQRELRAIGLG